MPDAIFTDAGLSALRDLLIRLEWTESDAWIRVSELSELFPETLAQDTPTFSSMPASEAAHLVAELQRILSEENVAVETT